MRHLLIAAALLLAADGALAAHYDADAIAGVWATQTGGYVQIYQGRGHWVGRIVGSASGKTRHDTHNPDKSKRARRLLGVVILKGLRYADSGKYEGGTIYDPNNGKIYKVKATMKGPDTLAARGYIGFSLFGKSQTWHRIDPRTQNVHQNLLHRPLAPGPLSSTN